MRRSSEENKEVLILDTAGLFAIQSLTSSQEIYTVPEAIEEVVDEESRDKLGLVIASGRIRITQPSQENIRYIKEIAKEIGVEEALSDTDTKILALAYQLQRNGYKTTIVSDDSFIHRVARILGIGSVSIKYRMSGRSRLRYYICPVCGYRSLKRFDICPICRTKIKR